MVYLSLGSPEDGLPLPVNTFLLIFLSSSAVWRCWPLIFGNIVHIGESTTMASVFLCSVASAVFKPDPRNWCYGVQQDFVLLPMVFSIYVKPLGKIICASGFGWYQYADDIQLYISLHMPPETLISLWVQNISAVVKWVREKKMKFNPVKTEVTLIREDDFLRV